MPRRRSQIVVALVAASATLLALEIAVRVLVRTQDARPRPGKSAYAVAQHDLLGHRLRPSLRFRAVKETARGTPCYDVVYTSDEHGRRIVPTPPDAPSERPRLVLFGCSYTLGEGLPDGETLAYRLGRSFEVVNYAAHSYGPQHTLAAVRSGIVGRELPPGRAVALYVLYPFHLERAVVASNHPGLWKSPYFELDENDRLQAFRSYADAHPVLMRPLRLLRLVTDRFALARYFNVRWPIVGEVRRGELSAAILAEAARRFEEEFGGPFAVAVEGRGGGGRDIPVLIERLRAAGVTVIDDSAIEHESDGFLCDGDNHPNGRWIAALAARLEPHLLRLAAGADAGHS